MTIPKSTETARRRRARISADPVLRAEEASKRAAWFKGKCEQDAYREFVNAGNRRRYATPEGRRKAADASVRSKYGITLAERDAMLVAQGGRCRFEHCREHIKFGGRGINRHTAHIDHCHATGKVRGILCGPCNTALGKLGDSVDSIEGVLRYLRGAK